MKPLVCAILLMCVTGCYRSSTYRYFSPLRASIGGSTSLPELRAGILAVIPLGTPRQQVEEKIRANFHTRIHSDSVPPSFAKNEHPGAARIIIHLYEHGTLAGNDGADAGFIFGAHSKLQDVIVYPYGGYL